MNKKIATALVVTVMIGLGVYLIGKVSSSEKIPTSNENCFTVEDGVITGYDKVCGKKVNIPKSVNGVAVKEIADHVFSGYELTDVVLPEGLETIGIHAFSNNDIDSLKLPSSLKEIKAYAFMDNKLEKISLPSNLETIGFAAFNQNKVKGDSAFIYQRLNGKENKEVIVSYAGNAKEVVLPSNVTQLYLNSMMDCGIEKIKLNDKLERIELNALGGNELTSITIPKSVEIIGQNAFSGNPLEKITIKGKTSIEEFSTFDTSYLETVKIVFE